MPILDLVEKSKLPNGIPERGLLMAHSTHFSQPVMTSLGKRDRNEEKANLNLRRVFKGLSYPRSKPRQMISLELPRLLHSFLFWGAGLTLGDSVAA